MTFKRCGPGLIFDDMSTCTILGAQNIELGANVGFNRYVFINGMGGIRIGDDARFGPYVIIHSADHRINDPTRPIRLCGHKKNPVAIGNDVWVGGHAIILRGASIPDHCVVAAGAYVDRRLKLKPYDIVVGNPARIVGNRLCRQSK